MQVSLSSIEALKSFVHIVNRFPYEVDLAKGRYVVDGKSIMGIFSLDLKGELELRIHADECEDLLNALGSLIVSEEG